MGKPYVLERERQHRGEYDDIGDIACDLGVGQHGEIRQRLEAHAYGQTGDSSHQELHGCHDDGIASVAELRHEGHLHGEEQGRQKRDGLAEPEGESLRPIERYEGDADDAHAGGDEVEQGRARARDGPGEKRHHDALHGGDNRALRSSGVQEPRCVRAVGEPEQRSEEDARDKRLGREIARDATRENGRQDDPCTQESYADQPEWRKRIHGVLQDDGSKPPDRRRYEQQELVAPGRNMETLAHGVLTRPFQYRCDSKGLGACSLRCLPRSVRSRSAAARIGTVPAVAVAAVAVVTVSVLRRLRPLRYGQFDVGILGIGRA